MSSDHAYQAYIRASATALTEYARQSEKPVRVWCFHLNRGGVVLPQEADFGNVVVRFDERSHSEDEWYWVPVQLVVLAEPWQFLGHDSAAAAAHAAVRKALGAMKDVADKLDRTATDVRLEGIQRARAHFGNPTCKTPECPGCDNCNPTYRHAYVIANFDVIMDSIRKGAL